MNILTLNLSDHELKVLFQLLDTDSSGDSASIKQQLHVAVMQSQTRKQNQQLEKERNEAWDATRAAACEAEHKKQEKAWEEYCRLH